MRMFLSCLTSRSIISLPWPHYLVQWLSPHRSRTSGEEKGTFQRPREMLLLISGLSDTRQQPLDTYKKEGNGPCHADTGLTLTVRPLWSSTQHSCTKHQYPPRLLELCRSETKNKTTEQSCLRMTKTRSPANHENTTHHPSLASMSDYSFLTSYSFTPIPVFLPHRSDFFKDQPIIACYRDPHGSLWCAFSFIAMRNKPNLFNDLFLVVFDWRMLTLVNNMHAIEHLLCASHFSRCLGYSRGQGPEEKPSQRRQIKIK